MGWVVNATVFAIYYPLLVIPLGYSLEREFFDIIS